MTACPATTQGSHHQTPKDPRSASQTAAPTWNPLPPGKEEQEEPAGGLAAVLAVQTHPCTGEWGWEGPKHPQGIPQEHPEAGHGSSTHSHPTSMAQRVPQSQAWSDSPTTAHPGELSRGTQTAHWKNRSQAWKPVAS